jgi:alpha-L-fucosidase
MNQRALLLLFPLAACADSIPSTATPSVIVDTTREPVATGSFQPTWDSLQQYECPEWFRDAKFGIWAHWGPQCQPEEGDWYARGMYLEGGGQYRAHVATYGHPSEAGFKEVIRDWKAENWEPQKLVDLYKRAGAKYFFAMANHHDNLDLWDSKYQPWNSVKVGPKKDIIAVWAQAARQAGLPFGVSVHAAHAWSWYEPAQGADRNGPKAGIPYDGKLTKADGKGKWWDGLDPQDLYAQNHAPAADFLNGNSIHARWNWGKGITQPDQAYCDKFYNRTIDLINRSNPDLLYFDDTALPLWPVSDAGLKIAAHFYNHNTATRGGKMTAVLFGKILTEDQREALVWDVERGAPNAIQPYPWQTDTCIGGWHYDKRQRYKSPAMVVHMLADIVSKNGNLLLNVPVRGDGSIDEKEERIVGEIASWMEVNGKAIHATRPWKVFGEGPAMAGASLSAQGFNEGKGKPYTAEDVRYTRSKDGKTVYAIILGWPDKPVTLRSLGKESGKVGAVKLLGAADMPSWKQEDDALVVEPPHTRGKPDFAAVYEVTLAD